MEGEWEKGWREGNGRMLKKKSGGRRRKEKEETGNRERERGKGDIRKETGRRTRSEERENEKNEINFFLGTSAYELWSYRYETGYWTLEMGNQSNMFINTQYNGIGMIIIELYKILTFYPFSSLALYYSHSFTLF